MRANTATLVYSLARGFSNLQVKSGMNTGLTGTSALVGNKPDPHGMVMVYDLNGHISHQDETQRQKKNKSATAKPVLQYLTASAAFCMHEIWCQFHSNKNDKIFPGHLGDNRYNQSLVKCVQVNDLHLITSHRAPAAGKTVIFSVRFGSVQSFQQCSEKKSVKGQREKMSPVNTARNWLRVMKKEGGRGTFSPRFQLEIASLLSLSLSPTVVKVVRKVFIS